MPSGHFDRLLPHKLNFPLEVRCIDLELKIPGHQHAAMERQLDCRLLEQFTI